MKKANTIISLLAVATLSFAAVSTNSIDFNQNMNLSINTSEHVYGIQYDMHYNPSHINVEELSNSSSLVSGVDIYSKVKEPGFIRVIMFSMNLDKIASANELTNVIDFNITPLTASAEKPVVVFDNIIIAAEPKKQPSFSNSFTP